MKLLIHHKIYTGFAVALACLLLIGVTSWWSALRNMEAFRSVNHAYEVLDKFEDTLVEMLDMETGSRGFAISGDETFLQPNQTGIVAVRKSLAEAKRWTQDSPSQQGRLAALESLIQEKINFASETIKLRRNGDTTGTIQLIADGQGKQTMDKIRNLIAEMEHEEEQLLQQRIAKAQVQSRMTIAIVVFGSLLAVGLIGLASVIVQHDFKKRRQAETERDQFFSLSLDVFAIANTDGYFKRVNHAFAATLGWSAEEILARPFLAFVHPDDHVATVREVEKLAAGQPTINFENRYQCKDGSWKWLAWRAVPQPDGTIYCTGRDMTETKLAQAKLEHERYLLQMLMENVPADIYFKDLEGRFLRNNRAQAIRFGLDNPSQAVGKTDFDFFSTVHATQAYKDEQQIIRTGQPVTKEEMETWPDGRETWALTSKLPLRDQQGQIIGTFGISHNITERREMGEALRRSEESLAVTLNSIGDAVLATDTEGRITRLNPIAETMTGWTQAEALGRPVAEVFCIINEETRVPSVIPVDRVLATGKIHGLANHTILTARGGIERPIADSAAPIRDKNGRILGVVLVFRDVTMEKKAEKIIRDSEVLNRAVLNSVMADIAVVDRRGKIIAINESWERFVREDGCDTTLPGVALGVNYLEICEHAARDLGDEAQEKLNGIRGVLAHSRVTFRQEYPCHLPAEKRWFSMQVSPLSRAEGGAVIAQINITERKQAEEALHASERRLRLALDAAQIGDWELDMETQCARRSLRHDQIFGYAELLPEWNYTLFLKHVHPEDRARVDQSFRDSVAAGREWYFECRIIRPDQAVRWIWAQGNVFKDHLGKPKQMIGMIGDITERKQAEEEIRNFNAGLEAIVAQRTAEIGQALTTLDATEDGAFIFDPETSRYTYVNEGAVRQLGYTREELLQMTPADIKPEFDEAKFRELLAPMLRNEVRTHRFTTLHRHKDGHDIPVEITLQYVTPVGERPRFINMVRDITERTREEENLRRFATVVRDSNDAITIQDFAGRITAWNRGAELMYGYTEPEALLVNIERLTPASKIAEQM